RERATLQQQITPNVAITHWTGVFARSLQQHIVGDILTLIVSKTIGDNDVNSWRKTKITSLSTII
ncbi:hypothetical protein ACJX0J_014933, partial [Zea mays]